MIETNGRDWRTSACVDLLLAVVERAQADASGTVTGVNGAESRRAIQREARDWLCWIKREFTGG